MCKQLMEKTCFCITFEAIIPGSYLTFLKLSRVMCIIDESVNYVSSTSRKPDIFEIKLLENLRIHEDRYIFPDSVIVITTNITLDRGRWRFNTCTKLL